MNNTVHDVDFTRALPQPLKNDETMLSLGRTIAGELQQNIQLARLTLIYPRIDELGERLLDILAVDFKVDWYDFNGTLEEKRKAVKECIYVHRYKGTKYAVETALKSIYANVVVSEWFEYGGEPYHFRVTIFDGTNDKEKRERILQKIKYYKNLRSVLDDVIFEVGVESDVALKIGVKFGGVYKKTGSEVKIYGME